MRPRTAVVTIAHGRHEHLEGQLWGLAQQSLQPDVFVVVAMDDPVVQDVVERHALPAWSVRVTDVAATSSGLPLAAARNAGARAGTVGGPRGDPSWRAARSATCRRCAIRATTAGRTSRASPARIRPGPA